MTREQIVAKLNEAATFFEQSPPPTNPPPDVPLNKLLRAAADVLALHQRPENAQRVTADQRQDMSKAERDARARLARNGRNPDNSNRGIAVGSDLHLCEMLLGELDAARAKLAAHTALHRETLDSRTQSYAERLVERIEGDLPRQLDGMWKLTLNQTERNVLAELLHAALKTPKIADDRGEE